MKAIIKITFSIAVTYFLCGCSSSAPPAANQTESAPPATNAAVANNASSADVAAQQPVVLPVNANSTPYDVVTAFLNGMRDGNSGVTGALLSARAQEETVKHNWPVQPPGAPSATYQLGNASFVDAGKSVVQVPCVWTEPDGQGGQVQFEVTWALRQQAEGWRIAGFASELVPGRPAYYFNFEDITALKATQAEAETAMMQLMEQQQSAQPTGDAAVAEKPTSPGSSTLR